MQLDLFNIKGNLQEKFKKSITSTGLKDFHFNIVDGNYTNIYMKDAFEDFKIGIKNRFIY